MKVEIGIVTINDDNNYGNRLQNYAVQQFCKKNDLKVETIKNRPLLNDKENLSKKFKYYYRIKEILKNIKANLKRLKRLKCFRNFNKNIIFSKKFFNIENLSWGKKYDFFIVGSDQVWNPKFKRLSDFDLLAFAKPEQRIAFSASFGISELPENCKEKAKRELEKFKAISVREEKGKEIIEELTGRKDVQVLVDPTMLLTSEEWDKVAKKPEQLKTDKYILNYFLGKLSEKRKKEIERVANENNCEIINILDKNSPFYQTGPSEFLYLEKNAFLICTDSFHSSVFAILYNKPFIVFNREDNKVNMNSRIETLLKKFNLHNREFTGTITKENLKHDYTEAYKILKKEKEKSIKFLKEALDIKN